MKNILAIDCGNSLVKWRLGTQLRVQKTPLADFKPQIWQPLVPQIDSVLIASVVPLVERQISDFWAEYNIEPLLAKSENLVSPTLTLCYNEPKQLGIDRYLGLLYAQHLPATQSIIIDAGTAITVDLLSNNHFIGGYIVPGRDQMLQALQATKIHFTIKNTSTEYSLGQDTNSCIANGINAIAPALVQHIMALEPNFKSATILVSGGNGKAIAEQLQKSDFSASYHPHLILNGLNIYARLLESR